MKTTLEMVSIYMVRIRSYLIGLRNRFNHFESALEMVLSTQNPTEEDLEDERYSLLYIIDIWKCFSKHQIYMDWFMPDTFSVQGDYNSWEKSISQVDLESVQRYCVRIRMFYPSEWLNNWKYQESRYSVHVVKMSTFLIRSVKM